MTALMAIISLLPRIERIRVDLFALQQADGNDQGAASHNRACGADQPFLRDLRQALPPPLFQLIGASLRLLAIETPRRLARFFLQAQAVPPAHPSD